MKLCFIIFLQLTWHKKNFVFDVTSMNGIFTEMHNNFLNKCYAFIIE